MTSFLAKPYFLTILYFTISLVGIINHEIWLDEAHHWLLARDSFSIKELIINTRYEGHPILWNLLLYLISRFTYNVFWMQLLHILISSTVVFIFLKYSPFKLIFKILFIFGYFILFEYNLLSRNYMLGVLFIFLACSIPKSKKFILYTFFLALAANVHAIFLIIVSSIMFIEAIELLEKKKFAFNLKYSTGWSIITFGLILSIYQIIPPSDTVFFNRISEIPITKKFTHGIMSLFNGLITLPDFRTIYFWNTNLLINLNKPIAFLFTILTYTLPLILFYRNKILIFYSYFGIIAANAFFYVTQMSSARYEGMLYILIIVGLWLDYRYPHKANKLNSTISIQLLEKIKTISIYSILVFQLLGGIGSYIIDLTHPFSDSKNIVNYLTKNNLQNEEIITLSCEGTTISAYLQKKIYFLCANKHESYCRWGIECNLKNVFNHKTEKLSSFIFKNKNRKTIYISTSLLEPTNINLSFKYKLLEKFESDIFKTKNYYIYEILSH